jgi:predicted dehydrogenase
MRVGVVGVGQMGRHHARILKKMDIVSDVMGCDIFDGSRKAAKKEGTASVATVAELLAWKPDAVIVATQATAHAPIIETFLKARIPVLTEKPLATTLKDSRRLVAMAQRLKVPFQVGFELRYCGCIRAMNDVIKSGRIGKPVNVGLIQNSGSHHKGVFTAERCQGLFWEKLCHQVDLYRYWLGEPERIMAVCGPTVMKHYSITDNALACMVFPGGRVGTISYTSSRAAQIGGTDDHGDRGHFYELTLTCTRGSVSFDMWLDSVSVVKFNHRKDCKSELLETFKVEPRYPNSGYNIYDQDMDFLQRVRDGKKLQFPASDALITMEWVAKGEMSLAKGGKWITA